MKKRTIAILMTCVLMLGCAIGGTLAWLTDDTDPVVNTFTDSDINITLTETEGGENKEFQMIPGWTIPKNPKVTVTADSEDCWLFVKITESTAPDLDAYISYAIADGWDTVRSDDAITVIGRKVYKGEGVQGFNILGAGSYIDPMGDEEDFTVSWNVNQVCVKPSVTKQMMTKITGETAAKPTLSFEAYAVQLFKTNSNNDTTNTDDEFTVEQAWAQAQKLPTSGSN